MKPASSRRVVLISALLAIAACGGKSTPTATPGPTTGSGVDEGAVRRELTGMAVPEACGGPDAAATIGAMMDEQQALLGGPDETDETFVCRSSADDAAPWECTWSVFSRPSGEADPDDPCAGEGGGGSGYQLIVQLDKAGAIVPATMGCNAPG